MLAIRKSDDRGRADFGWLDSRHTFSFGQYYDENHMGFGALRVINDDRVAAGGGFPAHPHADMEIISYVLDGALEHEDSLGTGSVVRPGDVQRMSAGRGIRHSEFNSSPSYEQKTFSTAEKRGRLRLVGSRDGRDGSVTIHQDADMYAGLLAQGETVTHEVAPGRQVWVQVATGSVTADGETLQAGDAVAVTEARRMKLAGAGDGVAEVLVFDLAA
jgi:quercetin 2,3-dioxygenase